MVLYIFLVGVLNLSIGLAVAVYMGRQYRELLALAEASARQAVVSEGAASAPPASSLSVDPAEERAMVLEQLELVESEVEVDSEVEDCPEEPSPSDARPELRPELDPDDLAESPQEADRVEGDASTSGPLRAPPDEDASSAAREGQGPDSAADVGPSDPSTGLSEEIGLAASLEAWRQEDPEGTRQLNAAMIDIDAFGKLNDRLGRDACDRILRAINGLVEADSRDHVREARFSGQRFLLLFPDVDLRFTINLIERIRQTLEKACFVHEGEEIKVTASCAVGEIMAEDTPETLHARVEATLHQAKRYKGNQTFVNEGKYPTPVVPPNLDLAEKSIPI